MAIRGNDGQALAGKVEEYAVHHGAQLILGSSKDRAVDVLSQQGVGDDNLGGGRADALRDGELIGILYGQGKHTILVGNLRNVGLLVNIEGDGLLREPLDGFEQIVVAYGKTAVGVAFGQLDLGLHHILTV